MSKFIKFDKGAFNDRYMVLFDKVEFLVGRSWEWGFQATYYHLEKTFTFVFIRWYLLITIYDKNLETDF
jgi:hypothetical protein